eukprot:648602-Prymnesium_polylepis.3
MHSLVVSLCMQPRTNPAPRGARHDITQAHARQTYIHSRVTYGTHIALSASRSRAQGALDACSCSRRGWVALRPPP